MITPNRAHFTETNVLAYRMVENQQKSASLELVNFDLDKHDVLEQILEDSKPPISEALSKRHYLIKTPFRYPPLRYGSRFGRTHELGIFYASLSLEPLFAEVAYYRFVFLHDMARPFEGSLTTEHTVFNVRATSARCLALDEAPFSQFQPLWSHRHDYSSSQTLGSQAREIDTQIIRYISARCPSEGRNIAILDHLAIKRSPSKLRPFRCTVSADKCLFIDPQTQTVTAFGLDIFLVDQHLPKPSD